jgi:hypothetical protein
MSRRLLDLIAPFDGQHNPLRNGWSTDQLHTVAQALGTSNLTIAFVACSLIAEQRSTGRPLRYSRSQSNYSYFDAYQGDPMMTYRRVVPAIDWLITNGYAEGHKGVWAFKKQSIVAATPKLLAFAHLLDPTQRQRVMLRDEIILRAEGGKSVGFTDTAEIRRMRQDMKSINAHLSEQQYFRDGSQLYIPPAVRIFNQTFRRGGRLYHQGSSYQQMRKKERAKIAMMVDGEVVPTVERDFESLHMRLVYSRAGKQMPAGDLYEVEGFTRKLAKVSTLVSLNADGTEVGAITSILEKDEDLALENGLYQLTKWELKTAIEKLIAAIKRKHYRVKEFFGTGVGAELMRTDSDIAVKIMLAMIERTGRCPLVVHDSFIVPKGDAAVLEEHMAAALTQAGPRLSRDPRSTPSSEHSLSVSTLSPIHLGKHSVDQEGSGLIKHLGERAYVPSDVDRHDPGLDPPPEDLQWSSSSPDLPLTATSTE